jgi:outer membrane lipoprotein-sorting protein
MNTRLFLTWTAAGLLASALTASAAAPTASDVVARARAVYGTEASLDGLTTLQYFGTMYDDKDQPAGSVVLQFKKPASQRSEYTTPTETQIEGTDGYEGWALKIDQNGRKGMAIIQPPQLTAYINSSFENLFFFRGPLQRRGGTITLDGLEDFHGAKSWKVSFVYPDSMTFIRYFDQNNYQLHGTVTDVTDKGQTEIIESGKIMSGGIMFPDTIKAYNDGKLVRTMKFSKVIVNAPLDDKMFEVPSTSILLPPPDAPLPSAQPATGASNPVPAGVTGFNAPAPESTLPSSTPPPTGTPSAANSTITSPPATPQQSEQPLMFNIKPTSN